MAGSDPEKGYLEATRMTVGNLMQTMIAAGMTTQLSQLELPEIERLTQEVARVVPAGNVPGLILNGLARLDGRTVEPAESQKHVGLLFKGMKVALDKAIYGTFFMGPAAVLYGYQQILRLAGKDPDSAFPDGTWQFYLEFALREDTARHSNETTGFQSGVAALKLSEADQLAAWLITAAEMVRQQPEMLANEWRERVTFKILSAIAEEHRLKNASELPSLYHRWEQQRPYRRPSETEQYPEYRRQRFNAFLQPILHNLRPNQRAEFELRLRVTEARDLPAYQRQMSWLAYLHPDTYNETRVAYRLEEAHIGVIWQGRYYLMPLTAMTDRQIARRTAKTILEGAHKYPPAVLDDLLVNLPREQHSILRGQLPPDNQADLHRLRYAPILINWDLQNGNQPLALVRRGKRGVGDHPLTIFRTADSTVFDQSHIFFDGAWGAAVAQIMTHEAMLWAQEFTRTPAPKGVQTSHLYSPGLQTATKKIPTTPEASAENTAIRLQPVQDLRKVLKQRNELAQVTVNDLFILYRALHALIYEPSPHMQDTLDKLSRDKRAAAQKATLAINEALERARGKNPAILIPIDASRHDPRERVYPMTFWNPLTDVVRIHYDTMQALQVYQNDPGQRNSFQNFEKLRAEYLRLVAGFGQLLAKYKDIALRGQSPGTLSIKALAHLPPMVQQWFSNIPGKFDVMNEVIKGEEVFSNVGRVAPGSTLRRFITAKDDNRQKTLCWGALTDDHGIVHLSLRDFRPHVKVLHDLNMGMIAQMLTQDYLNAYAEGFNQYIRELHDITIAGSKTTGRLRSLFG